MLRNQDAITEVLDQFDFDKVHKVMEFLAWTWASSEGVPKVSSLILTAIDLLNQAIEAADLRQEPVSIGTGGFKAEAEFHEGKLYLSLAFYVDEASNIY